MSLAFKNTQPRFTDAETGIEIIRTVGDAASSAPPSYDWPAVTPDNHFVITRCEFGPESGRPSGFYRVNLEGDNMLYLGPEGIHPRMTPDGKWMYLLHHDEPVVYRTDMENGGEEAIVSLEDALPEGWVYAQMRYSPASDHLFVHLRQPDNVPIRVDLGTGDVVRMEHVDGMLWACAAEEPRLVVIRQRRAEPGKTYDYLGYRRLEQEPGDRSIWSLDVDGGDARLICVDYYSHATMLGKTTKTQGCGKWGTNAVTVCAEGEAPRVVAEGPYFWHSGASYDGEWIAADTNWPDYGIMLVHVPTGNFRRVCYPESSFSTGLLHPHPGLSFDGRIMTFRSDREEHGIGQAYHVRLPDELRESVMAGVSDEPAGGWQVKEG